MIKLLPEDIVKFINYFPQIRLRIGRDFLPFEEAVCTYVKGVKLTNPRDVGEKTIRQTLKDIFVGDDENFLEL